MLWEAILRILNKLTDKCIFITKFIFASCFFLVFFIFIQGCNTNKSTGGTDMSKHPITYEENMIVVGPTKEFTLEDHVQTANELLAAVTDSYQQMLDSTTNSSASAKGINAAEKVREKYDARIEELKATDFSTWSAEDLSELSLELSNIISAIREARDLLSA